MRQDGCRDSALPQVPGYHRRATSRGSEGVFMRRLMLVAAAALAVAPAAGAARPVPSLTPAATQKLWRAEVARVRTQPRVLADAACKPARAVFYAQTDWLRLATKLAQQPSPCA